MADIIDIANERAELFLLDSVSHALGKSAPEQHPGFDGLHCVDCEDEIPPLRLAQWRVRCVECQATFEWETKVGRR